MPDGLQLGQVGVRLALTCSPSCPDTTEEGEADVSAVTKYSGCIREGPTREYTFPIDGSSLTPCPSDRCSSYGSSRSHEGRQRRSYCRRLFLLPNCAPVPVTRAVGSKRETFA